MSEWRTSAELAGLPGLPGTDRRVRDKALREDWQSRKRAGRGGGQEYHITSLPPETRATLLSRQAIATHVETARTLPARVHVKPDDATTDQLKTAFSRAGLCRAIDRMAAHGDMSITAACRHMAELLSSGKADATLIEMAMEANDRPRDGHVVSARSLIQWHKDFAIFGEGALIPGRRKKTLSVPAWAGAFLKRYQIPTSPSVEDAYRLFKADLNGGDAPSIHQVRRFLNKLSPEAREQGRMGARELKNIQPFRRRTFETLMPNDIWTADGHTFDAEIAHPLYPDRVFRPELTTYADIRTRRITGWSVNLAESAMAVLDGLRVGIAAHGIPAVLYVDNGPGYINQAVGGVLDRLGITLSHALPYNSQAKGVVERLNQVWVRLAKRLPTYIGVDMDKEAAQRVHKITRQALKAGVQHRAIVGWDAFLSLAADMVAEYNASLHATLKCSPDEALERHIHEGWAPATVDPAQLDRLMMPSIARKTLRGEVRLFNRRYAHDELRHHHDDEVLVHYDLRDASRVWVHDLSGRLICEARKDGNASAYMPGSFIADAVERRERQQVKRLADKIETVTGRTVEHIQLAHQHAVTLDGLFSMDMHTLTTAERVHVDTAADALKRLLADTPEFTPPEDSISRYRLWQALGSSAAASEDEAQWFQRYGRTDEKRSMDEFFADPAFTQGLVAR